MQLLYTSLQHQCRLPSRALAAEGARARHALDTAGIVKAIEANYIFGMQILLRKMGEE
jgi:hypothetical protein